MSARTVAEVARGFFENDAPIDDVLTVLDLLYNRWGAFTTRSVHDQRGRAPYVEVGYHHDFSDSTVLRFEIAKEMPEKLLRLGMVQGVPRWGYTDMRELRISEEGKSYLWSERKRVEMSESVSADRWLRRRP